MFESQETKDTNLLVKGLIKELGLTDFKVYRYSEKACFYPSLAPEKDRDEQPLRKNDLGIYFCEKTTEKNQKILTALLNYLGLEFVEENFVVRKKKK